jgi:hypothetical protein
MLLQRRLRQFFSAKWIKQKSAPLQMIFFGFAQLSIFLKAGYSGSDRPD